MRCTRLSIAALLIALATVAIHAQSKAIAPGGNLVIDGIPAIPATLADDVRRYTEARPANFRDWHPTSREMLISTRFGNTAQVHHVKMPGGARTQLTFFSEPVGGATFEPAAGHVDGVQRAEPGHEGHRFPRGSNDVHLRRQRQFADADGRARQDDDLDLR